MGESRTGLDWAVKALSVVLYAASSVVLGFCAGRWFGPLILRGGAGLEMQDLGYMFTGAVLGGVGGLVLGVHKARSRAAGDALRGSGLAVMAALLAVLFTVLLTRP